MGKQIRGVGYDRGVRAWPTKSPLASRRRRCERRSKSIDEKSIAVWVGDVKRNPRQSKDYKKGTKRMFNESAAKKNTTRIVEPRVFISYSWDIQDRAFELANRLRSDGIEVVMDDELMGGNDMHAFMERSVRDPTITNVLVLCNKTYAEKADGRVGGVGEETQIITPEVYGQADQSKFIPVIMELSDPAGQISVPIYMRGKKYYNLADTDGAQEEYRKLVCQLYGVPANVKSPLGQVPSFVTEAISALKTNNGRMSENQELDADAQPVDVFSRFGVRKPMVSSIGRDTDMRDFLEKKYREITDGMKALYQELETSLGLPVKIRRVSDSRCEYEIWENGLRPAFCLRLAYEKEFGSDYKILAGTDVLTNSWSAIYDAQMGANGPSIHAIFSPNALTMDKQALTSEDVVKQLWEGFVIPWLDSRS